MFARLYSLVCPTKLASERQIFIPEWKIRCPWASDHQLEQNRRPIYVSTVVVSAAHIPGGGDWVEGCFQTLEHRDSGSKASLHISGPRQTAKKKKVGVVARDFDNR